MSAPLPRPATIIDAHHHLWRYSSTEYGWIDDRMAKLKRDFLPNDLATELTNAGVDGTVAIQARQTLAETQWLLDLANQNPAILGVVGWAPIAADEFEQSLEKLTGNAKLAGLRHVVQAEPDGFLDNPSFNRGIRAMGRTNLVYDLLITDRQLEETASFVDRHPRQIFVLDHIAKPKIALGELEPWRSEILELSKRDNVYCKISGMVTEASWTHWSLDSLRPYLDTVVEAFGTERLMAGSDWPVCLLATSYDQWWRLLREYFSGHSELERAQIFGATARKIYHLQERGL